MIRPTNLQMDARVSADRAVPVVVVVSVVVESVVESVSRRRDPKKMDCLQESRDVIS